METAVLFNFFEFRTGVWLPKAYFVGLDSAGHPVAVHQTAKATGLGLYGIETTPALLRALELVATLREKSLVEVFRRGAKKVPALAGLINGKERENVLRYLHQRSSELLEICQEATYPVTLNLDTRSSPQPYRIAFADQDWEAKLSFTLDEDLTYRLRLVDPRGREHFVRHLDPKILTNRPAPGWLVVDGRCFRVSSLRGDAIKPFLSRDEVIIPQAKIGKYLREFVAAAAKEHTIQAEGFEYNELTKPTGLRLAARPHPFEDRYYLYPEVLYGRQSFGFADSERVAVNFSTHPPYWIHRIVRNQKQEAELLQPLFDRGLAVVNGTNALQVVDQDDPFAPLAWLLRWGSELEKIEIVPAEREGQRFTQATGHIDINVSELGDWLDLKGTVAIGEHRIPFSQLVRHIQREDRYFPLPDGTLFLIPEEWFTDYGPGLQFAKVEAKRVRLARSQSPLLAPLGLELGGGDLARQLAEAYHPSSKLQATLRPYQLEGARWLVRHYHERLGACLADDMGLGKTLQTIAVLLYAKENLSGDSREQGESGPSGAGKLGTTQMNLFAPAASDEAFLQPLRALIVLPASLVFNWVAELQKFAPSLTVHANIGTKRSKDARVLRRNDVLITTYQTALRDREILAKIDFEYIVLDESQQIKNRQSKVFRALNELNAKHRISLSGTPIENSLSDLWSQMQFINPGLLRSYAFFRRTFITPIETHDDDAKKEQLRSLVSPHLLRRTKAEVAPDLPDLDVQIFYCDMTAAQRKVYEMEKSAARNALLKNFEPANGQYKLRVVQTLTRLRQLANHPVLVEEDYKKGSGKFAQVIEQWDTVRRSGQKVLIFSSMVRHLELFKAHLRQLNQPYAWITGGVNAKARAREVARFQEDPELQTFFISIKAGGTGLNLTAADYVFILDPWWNPTTEDQAIARAHRIGRQGNVFARKFLTKNTLEEKIQRLQQRKKQLAEDIIGTGGGLDFDRGELEYLLQ